ncbi:hypothetical protein [Paraburkholderia sp. MM5384-R2]|uniref:hypothetical protein n=1 Tax=Paraburkholderia sp. MM5384-R2 TaxID=2723097 RepID=UPI00160D1891|nr:hypothetical protein [Paraburkholderia sp. MM5384-R2]MBB5503242.1 hypothetical protein [Paraburkholderia sp. MM5384-R2]
MTIILPSTLYTEVQETFLLQGNTEGEVQITEMIFCPATGKRGVVPEVAAAWRDYHRHTVWSFNPWTGANRTLPDIQEDPYGRLLLPPGEKLTKEFEAHTLLYLRAAGAISQFKRAGWTAKFDAVPLIVELRNAEHTLTFRLTETRDEERFYQLLRLEAWRLASE